jgi:hypothetical protein
MSGSKQQCPELGVDAWVISRDSTKKFVSLRFGDRIGFKSGGIFAFPCKNGQRGERLAECLQ